MNDRLCEELDQSYFRARDARHLGLRLGFDFPLLPVYQKQDERRRSPYWRRIESNGSRTWRCRMEVSSPFSFIISSLRHRGTAGMRCEENVRRFYLVSCLDHSLLLNHLKPSRPL